MNKGVCDLGCCADWGQIDEPSPIGLYLCHDGLSEYFDLGDAEEIDICISKTKPRDGDAYLMTRKAYDFAPNAYDWIFDGDKEDVFYGTSATQRILGDLEKFWLWVEFVD